MRHEISNMPSDTSPPVLSQLQVTVNPLHVDQHPADKSPCFRQQLLSVLHQEIPVGPSYINKGTSYMH